MTKIFTFKGGWIGFFVGRQAYFGFFYKRRLSEKHYFLDVRRHRQDFIDAKSRKDDFFYVEALIGTSTRFSFYKNSVFWFQDDYS